MKNDIQTLFDLFTKWEQKYPVEKWKVREVHIWPILKKIIYFILFRENQHQIFEKGNRTLNFFKILFKKIPQIIFAVYKLRTLGLKKSKFLFSGAPAHRVNWQNNEFNRYFDPIMDYLESKGENSYLLEYHKIDLDHVYKSNRVFNAVDLLPFFRVKDKINLKKLELHKIPGLESFLSELEKETGLKQQIVIKMLLINVNAILQWANLYCYFIKKTNAKFIFGLCYYTNPIYGMNLAASKLGIKSLDMQHGLQGVFHPAYYFKKVPSAGFNILPDYFWVWETSSNNNIADWTRNSIHKAVLGGNPWIDFINADKSLNKIKGIEKPMILYTLQPLKPMLADHLIELIKSTCKEYSWWLRLHPRMTTMEISEIEKKLYKYKIKDQINIKEATDLPLPFLLNNCKLHISGSSGSIAEAALMQKPSLIVDELGVKSYKDLIEKKLAVECLTKNPVEIIKLIENILKNPEIQMENQAQMPTNYKSIIDEFIKKT